MTAGLSLGIVHTLLLLIVTGGRQEVMEMAEWKRNTIVKAKGRIPKPGQRILRSVCAVCLHSGA